VALGEGDEVGQPRHGAVFVHDLADHARGVQPGQPRDIDRRLGMARAHQHAAIAGAQRKDMARRRDVLRPLPASIATCDGARPVMRRNAGRHPLARLDRHVKAVSWRDELFVAISGRPSCVDPFARHRQADQPAPWVAMKLIASGVAHCAGITRSPSFSRSSWSTRMNIRPLRASSMISSTD
jgi:hypothetical protein